MSCKPDTEKHKLGDISKHASMSSGAAAYAKRTGIRLSGVFAVICRPPGGTPRLFGTIFGRIWHGFGGPCGKGRRHSQRAFVNKNDMVSPQCPRALAWRVCWGPPFTSLPLRSLRLAHKSTSKLVLLVLVTRVCQAAFRELRSRQGETIDFKGMAAETRSAIVLPRRWPLPPGGLRYSAGGLKTRRVRCRSRFGSAFGVILGALAVFFGPIRFTGAFRMRSGLHLGTPWTTKSMLPSRREHRFQKISISAIYPHLGVKITSQNHLLDAPMALKTLTPKWQMQA